MIVPPEGPLLAIDTSTRTGSIAVGDGQQVLAEVVLGIAGRHSEALLPALDAGLRWAGVRSNDLRGVVVAGGPGSFTGLRIGAATAKGIVQALGLPLLSYSSLLVAAAGAATASLASDRPVCALFDARRREVFTATYRFHAGDRPTCESVSPPEVLDIETLISRYRSAPAPIFIGDGARLHADEIRSAFGDVVVSAHFAIPRASTLLWLVAAFPEGGAVDRPASWEPEYLRPSGAERIAAQQSAAG